MTFRRERASRPLPFARNVVHLNDPAAEYADTQVPIAAFTNAWRTGEDSIVVTS